MDEQEKLPPMNNGESTQNDSDSDPQPKQPRKVPKEFDYYLTDEFTEKLVAHFCEARKAALLKQQRMP